MTCSLVVDTATPIYKDNNNIIFTNNNLINFYSAISYKIFQCALHILYN